MHFTKTIAYAEERKSYAGSCGLTINLKRGWDFSFNYIKHKISNFCTWPSALNVSNEKCIFLNFENLMHYFQLEL